ncbi:MAG: hypothetical protein CVV34_01295 [Methanomicrobiales archaeon HGW-Methanomicrobiales-5]|nr:MAG: hypothetical protein CVV34_01295 [Methanomicrobiales archaeon HGW-Methanomicrobiales-5]
MNRFTLIFIPVIALVCVLLVAGCTTSSDQTNLTNTTPTSLQQFPSSYQMTIAQPDGSARFIHMDTDVYNIGEVVEFYITGESGKTLECSNDPPTYSVKFQAGRGVWATKMGKDTPDKTNKTYLGAGTSTQMYRFITTGWEPNRYRIVSDCGVSREFLLRPVPTPAPTVCPPAVNEPLWVRINPISDHDAGKPFSISGTTNRAVGDELKYLVFPSGMLPKNLVMGNDKPLSIRVSEGTCGENTWSVDLDLSTPQEYYLMISAGTQNATAIKRFMVL